MSQNYEEFLNIKKKADAIQNQPNFANYVIEDPNVMGQITELNAKIYMRERSWDLAEKAFQKAIVYFQVNDFQRALLMQKYRVFAFMLGGQEIIFDTPEAYIYVKDPGVAAVCMLIRGFKDLNIEIMRQS